MSLPSILTLLHADDEPIDRTMLRRAVRIAELPFHIVSLHDGKSVEDYLLGKGTFSDREIYPMPDALLLDIKMPRLNGMDTLDWLRHHPDFSSLIVVVLSGLEDPAEIRAAYSKGAHGYFLKTTSTSDLVAFLKTLHQWLNLISRPVWPKAKPIPFPSLLAT